MNRPQDVVALKNALAWVGRYPVDKARQADPRPDEDLTWGLHGFQRDFGLKQDGLSNPGGETETRLNTLITPMLQLAGLDAGVPLSQSDAQRDQEQETSMRHPAPRDQQAQVPQPNPASQPNQPAPVNQTTPVPPIPEYTDSTGNTTTRVTQSDWDTFHGAMDNAVVSALEREVFGKIYSAEGGGRADGTTVAGITVRILNDLRNNSETWMKDRLNAVGITKSTTPDQLSPDQQVAVYRIYMDEVIGPAKASGGVISGMGVLHDRIGDPNTIAAVADTLFRAGGPEGTKMVQQAINRTLAENGSTRSIVDDGIFGSGSLSEITNFASNPDLNRQFIENLVEIRIAHYASGSHAGGEETRTNSFLAP